MKRLYTDGVLNKDGQIFRDAIAGEMRAVMKNAVLLGVDIQDISSIVVSSVVFAATEATSNRQMEQRIQFN